MDLFFFQKGSPKPKEYTHRVIRTVAQKKGHNIIDSPQKADLICVSICDVQEIDRLKKVREKYRDKTILVGGHFSVFFKVLSLFADIVNVGQVFEVFECETVEEMKSLDCTYTGTENKIRVSTKIDWSLVPAVQRSSGTVNYWFSVGCKNKCHFCLTSWTNKHQTNSEIRVKRVVKNIPEEMSVDLISNEYKHPVPDKSGGIEFMKLRLIENFLNAKKEDFMVDGKKYMNMLSIGIEFCTEENRRKYAKTISNEEFKAIIDHAKELEMTLQLYMITGLETEEQWLDFLTDIPRDTVSYPRVTFMFTNLDMVQYTPLFKKIRKADLDNYFSQKDISRWYDKISYWNRRTRTQGPSHPSKAWWRMGMQLTTNPDEFEVMWKFRNSKDTKKIHDFVIDNLVENHYEDMVSGIPAENLNHDI